MVDLGAVAFGVVFVAIGSVMLYTAYYRSRAKRVIQGADAVSPGAVTPGGPAKVAGEVRAVEGTHEGPVDREPAVVTGYEIQSYETSGKTNQYRTRHSETTTEPFELVGDGGRVRVPESDPTLRVSAVTEQLSQRAFERRADLGMHLEKLDEEMNPFDLTDDWRHRQRSVRPGEEVYVYGEVTDDGSGPPTVDRTSRGLLYVLEDEDSFQSSTDLYLVGLGGVAFTLVGLVVLARLLPV